MNFGERLKNLRAEAGFTQETLARRLGVTKSVVSYYERQERLPSPEVLVQIAGIFHVTTDYLLDIGHEQTLDVSDLTESDMLFLLLIANALRRKRSVS